MSFEPRDYLRHIQVEIEYLTTVSEGVALGRFLDDATLQRAFVRSLEVIGEAAKVVLGAIWTFNMFNVIYLVSDGRPAGSTDILVTEAYRWAFERGERYGMSAAYATLIFGILLLWTVFGSRIGRKEKPA
jgi:hypothetical protein